MDPDMNAPRPTSIDFDNFPTGDISIPGTLGSFQFNITQTTTDPSPFPFMVDGFITTKNDDQNDHYLQLSTGPFPDQGDAFTITATSGSSFNLQSMGIRTYSPFVI